MAYSQATRLPAKRLEPPREPPSSEGRTPPHNLDAEAAVLSAIMLSDADSERANPRALDAVAGYLRPEHFYSEAHKRTYEAALTLYLEGNPTDVVHVAAWLKDREREAQVGGIEYLTSILDTAPAIANVDKYGRIVFEKWRARQVIVRCQRIAATGYIDYGDVGEYIAGAVADLDEVLAAGPDDVSLEGVDEIFDADDDEVDHYIVPALRLGEGRTAIIGGDSYTGKSVIAQSLALSVATGRDVWGVYRVETTGRVLHLNYDQSGKLAKRRYRRLSRALGIQKEELRNKLTIAQFPKLYLDDEAVEAQLARLVRGYKLCIVDALVGFVRRTEEKSEQMGRLLLQLMHVSERTGCTFLIIHHTSKPQPQGSRGPKKSGKDRLRGSGSIFGSADAVLILESTGKKKPVKVEHEKAPSDGQTLDDFYLLFEDVEEPELDVEDVIDLTTGERRADAPERPRRPKWGLRVRHVDAEEYSRTYGKEVAKVDKAQAFAQLCTRVLELVKAAPGSTGNALYEQCPNVRKASFFAALDDLARPQRAGGALVVGEKGPKNSRVWRAV